MIPAVRAPARAGVNRRNLLRAGLGALASIAVPSPAFAATRPFDGVTLRGAAPQHRFFSILQGYVPEFEAETGMQVELKQLPFGQYNAMIERELASDQPTFDVVNVTSFLAAQWMASGCLANLDEFTADPNVTPAEWAPGDFVAGAQLPYRDADGGTHAYAWEGGATIMGVSRMDLMERKGLLIPRTFEELRRVCAEMHQPGEVNGFVSCHLHHWCFVPYLQGFGGDVFANAPFDKTPTLNSDQAVQALEFYASLLKYAPRDVATYTEEQARASLAKGRSNIFIHSSSWVAPSLLADDSKVRDTARIARMPVGPVSDRPAANSQGLGIPKAARHRAAAWEFVKWALSPDMTARIVREHGHASVCRRSVIESEAYRSMNKVNGEDLGALYLDVLEHPTRGKNYMAYRTVRQFPIVGECINAAVQDVISGRAAARDALNAAQALAIARLART